MTCNLIDILIGDGMYIRAEAHWRYSWDGLEGCLTYRLPQVSWWLGLCLLQIMKQGASCKWSDTRALSFCATGLVECTHRFLVNWGICCSRCTQWHHSRFCIPSSGPCTTARWVSPPSALSTTISMNKVCQPRAGPAEHGTQRLGLRAEAQSRLWNQAGDSRWDQRAGSRTRLQLQMPSDRGWRPVLRGRDSRPLTCLLLSKELSLGPAQACRPWEAPRTYNLGRTGVSLVPFSAPIHLLFLHAGSYFLVLKLWHFCSGSGQNGLIHAC